MIRSLFSLCLFCVIFSSLFAQKGNKISHRLYFYPLHLVNKNFLLGYELKKGKKAVCISATYKPDYQQEGKVEPYGHGYPFGVYYFQSLNNHLYKSIQTKYSLKYYLESTQKYYLETEFFQNTYWFNRKNASFDNIEGYSFNGLRSERMAECGVKGLMGKLVFAGKNPQKYPYIDVFFGCAYTQIYYSFFTYNGMISSFALRKKKYINQPENGKLGNISFPIGIKLGYTW